MEKIMGFRMYKNEKGVTLIELLATLVLLSIILLLVNSVHLFGQKQMNLNTKEIQIQSNDRLAISLITKEIRKAQLVEVDATNDQLKINGTDVYKLDGTTLKKNNEDLISNINKFRPKKNGNQIKLAIGNLPETTIYLRE